MTRVLTSLLILLALTLPATAKRVALVIGNDSYSNQIAEAKLKKAVNDATAVRDTLMKLGFDVVFRTNASQRDFKNAVLEFSRKIKKDDVAMFFFAGHGAALKGTNYFLPSDIPKLELPDTPSEQDIEAKVAELAEFSVRESFVLEQISKNEPKVSLLIMDACRDNPLRDDSGDNPFRSFSRGGVVLGDNISTAEKAQPEGMIIVYSASFGQRALDRLSETETEPNSPFTRSFLKNLNQPGMGLKQVVAATKEEVFKLAKSINETQTPAVYDQLFGGDVFLSGELLSTAPLAPAENRNHQAALAFNAAAGDINVLRVVANEFADTMWGKLAAGRVKTWEEKNTQVEKGSLDIGALEKLTKPVVPKTLKPEFEPDDIVITPVAPGIEQQWKKKLTLNVPSKPDTDPAVAEDLPPLPLPPPPREKPRTIHLEADGSGEYKTLAEAVGSAPSGSRIELGSGTYEGAIVVSKPLHIVGLNLAQNVVVTAKDISTIKWWAEGGSVSNLTILQEGGKCQYCHALWMIDGKAIFSENVITSKMGDSIYVSGSNSKLELVRNKIVDSAGSGVLFVNGATGTIGANYIAENYGSGVEVRSGSAPLVTGNKITENGKNRTDKRNELFTLFDHSGHGISIEEEGLGRVEHNLITKNFRSGISVSDRASPHVANNYIRQNGDVGIQITDGGGGSFNDNDLRENKRGAWKIAKNTIINTRVRNQE